MSAHKLGHSGALDHISVRTWAQICPRCRQVHSFLLQLSRPVFVTFRKNFSFKSLSIESGWVSILQFMGVWIGESVMMMEKIETKTQEVVLLLTVVGALSLVVSGGIYLSLSVHEMSPLAGNLGIKALEFLFTNLGHSVFYLALIIVHLGLFLVRNLVSPSDIKRVYKRLSGKLILETGMLCLIAATITVLQSYLYGEAEQMFNFETGGRVGSLIGGRLYTQFGLIGSGVALFSALSISLILLGRLQLVTLFYSAKSLAEEFLLILRKYYTIAFSYLKRVGKSSHKVFFEGRIDWLLPIMNSLKREYGYASVAVGRTSIDQTVALETPPFSEDLGEERLDSEAFEESVAVDIPRPSSKSKSVNKSVEMVSQKSKSKFPKDVIDNVASRQPVRVVGPQPYKKRYNKPANEILEFSEKGGSCSKIELEALCKELEERLASFGIEGRVLEAHEGARLVMFEFQPAPGVRLSKITGLTSDLALMLGADSIRILAPIPGKTTVGIEVPREEPEVVKMGDMLKPLTKAAKSMNLPIVIGKDINNEAVVEDISKMPHMLVSGTTGSGKSVFINNLIVSLLYTRSPKNLRFIMIDPKMIELSPYNGIPHLLKAVVTDLTEAKEQLVWAQKEMDRRYQVFSDLGTRDIHSFNQLIKSSEKKLQERKVGKKLDWAWQELPQIVIIVDELADLMITQGKEVEIPITRIAQKARAAGIHLILATQRPSAEVVTGLIKTNFPTRVAFKVSSSIDSRTILDATGAEKLLGNGDMLFMANGKSTVRYQSPFISEGEVKKLVSEIS